MPTFILHIDSERLDPAVLQDKVRALATDIERHSEALADLPMGEAVPNTRGEPVTLGTLFVTFLSSGAAVALLEVIKAHVSRDRSVRVTIERPDGTKATLDAQNLANAQALASSLLATAAPQG